MTRKFLQRSAVMAVICALHISTSFAYDINTVDELSDTLELNTNSVKVIKREEWGADESLRFYKTEVENPPVIELSDETKEKFKDELKIEKTVTKQNGKTLIWPLQYAEKITKFIIHHTATDVKEGESIQSIKDIYHSHAVNRGWGDIGYNYLVDQDGNIYEGRYGGEKVVGGHAGVGNIGSIGISVLGTYSETKVPKKVISSLIRLIAEKSKIYGINPSSYSFFRGEISPNVMGHREIMPTECPGDKLQSLLSIIGDLASHLVSTTTVSNLSRFKSYEGYDYADKSGILYVEMEPSEEKEIIVKLENTGSKTWRNGTFLTVNSNPDFENVINFPDKKGAVLANMQEQSVAQSQTATFKIKLQTEIKSDLLYLNLAPVIDGEKKLPKYVILPLLVANADYSHEIVGSKLPPAYIKAGQKFEGYIDIKNLGNVKWSGNGKTRVALGTDHEKDRISEFADPKGTRLGYLINKEVKPGETGRFLLRLKAPEKRGLYEEYFTPVMEGITSFDDKKSSFKTFVYEKDYDSEVDEMTPERQIKIGETRTMWVKLKNMGGKKWTKDNFYSAVTVSANVKVANIKLQEDTVMPGETATITFSVEAKNKLGNEIVYLRPRVKNRNVFKGVIKFPLTIVREIQAKKNRNGNNIRIKISFNEEFPKITANGKFSMYVDNIKKATYEASKEITVSGIGDEVYRFAPEGISIMEISNFENRPSWNNALNDNKYRGVLEVRKDDDKIIVINELSLEDYLKGLAENANDEQYEKMKALIVLARSYALYYMTEGEKFPGEKYDLTDDPATSQKYLGYGYEIRSPNNSKAVLATRGKVVKYNGKVIKTPYFTQSDGRTRSAEEVWGWTDAPYLQSVPDPYCEGLTMKGHGVGMSACGARKMAGNGKTYQEIINYYFQNIVISKVY